MQLRALAKINLSLRVLSRRTDGFHEIETLMAPVSLYDDVTITLSTIAGQIDFICDDPSLPAGDDNLVMKAARLFLDAARTQQGLKISLNKRIPHGAGLGGGSSDAAAVLLGLNELLGAIMSENELAALGAQIGSDVPFFILRSPAVCRGRGELVEATELAVPIALLLLKPAFGVPTAWAYSGWQDSRELPGVSYQPQEFRGLNFVNDLERPVFEKHVFLARMKMWLLAQPEVGAAMLSGSGSTIFAVLHDHEAAARLGIRAQRELDSDLWTCACETVSGS